MSERTEAFKKELCDLLKKYYADLRIENHYTGYAECGSDNRIHVEFDYHFDELDLGSYFDGKE